MKKVIFNLEQLDTVDVKDINDYSNIGIEWGNGVRSIVIKKEKGVFVGMSADSILNSWGSASKREYVERANKQKGEIFIFDTLRELYRWLSEAEVGC